MKIQPIDCEPIGSKPPARSRFKRLFARTSSSDHDDFEPNSVCLTKMVHNFIEGNHEKHSVKCIRHRSNCFNGSYSDESDDEYHFCHGCGDSRKAAASCEVLKGLVCCASSLERNLLIETTKIVEKNSKICSCKNKTDCRKAVMAGLKAIGYDASICKSRWEKTSSYPCGEHEYIDVMIDSERVVIDLDFKSEFEIARSTKNYRSILQALPTIFVGKSECLQQIVSIVSEAANQSFKKKGMHVAPWRKQEYMTSKWLSPYTTTRKPQPQPQPLIQTKSSSIIPNKFSGDFELIFKVVVTPWEPKSAKKGTNTVVVAGLASIFKDKL